MASTDAYAHAELEAWTRAGGSWWLGILESRPVTGADLLAAVPGDVAPIASVEIPRDSATWGDAVARSVSLLDPVAMPASTADCSPAAWCLFADSAMTTPLIAGWLSDLIDGPLPSGSVLVIPAETVTLTHP